MFEVMVNHIFMDDDEMLQKVMSKIIEDDQENRYRVFDGFDTTTDMYGYTLITARAVCIDDEPDEDGEVGVYEVQWAVHDDYKGDSMKDLCSWDLPYSVEEICEMISLEGLFD